MFPLHTLFVISLFFASTIAPSKCNNNIIHTNDNNNSPVSKISYSTTGGRSGNYERLDVSVDSLVYMQARRGNEKTIKEKTEKAFWNGLTKSINLKDFDKIKSSPGHALYDGIDITLLIETGTEKHLVVNGNEDSLNYNRIRPFTDLLEKKLSQLRKGITW